MSATGQVEGGATPHSGYWVNDQGNRWRSYRRGQGVATFDAAWEPSRLTADGDHDHLVLRGSKGMAPGHKSPSSGGRLGGADPRRENLAAYLAGRETRREPSRARFFKGMVLPSYKGTWRPQNIR